MIGVRVRFFRKDNGFTYCQRIPSLLLPNPTHEGLDNVILKKTSRLDRAHKHTAAVKGDGMVGNATLMDPRTHRSISFISSTNYDYVYNSLLIS